MRLKIAQELVRNSDGRLELWEDFRVASRGVMIETTAIVGRVQDLMGAIAYAVAVSPELADDIWEDTTAARTETTHGEVFWY